jgi:hypothetical protein
MLLYNDLATRGIISIDNKLCDDCVGNGNSGEEEEGYKHILEPMTSSAKAHPAYETVK